MYQILHPKYVYYNYICSLPRQTYMIVIYIKNHLINSFESSQHFELEKGKCEHGTKLSVIR